MTKEQKSYQEKLLLREKCNSLLHDAVTLYKKLFPDLRYIQVLWCLGIIDQTQGSVTEDTKVIDRFSEEPYDTVVRILPNIIGLINNHFPEKSKATDRIFRHVIITGLERLGLARRIPGSFKLKTI